MMFGDRLRLSGQLELLTDLHLGSGLVERPAREDEGETGLVLRGEGGRAVIPGTSLKGALRAAAQALGMADLATFFGPEQVDAAHKAHLGRLWLHAAPRIGDDDRSARHAGLTRAASRREDRSIRPAGTRRDGYVRARLGRDPQTRAAGPHLLFNEEVVAAGERFGFEALLFLDDPEPPSPSAWWWEGLLRLLHPLLRREGMALGAGTRLGEGRVRLRGDTLAVEHLAIDPDSGSLAAKPLLSLVQALQDRSTRPTAAGGRRWQLTLTCDGPFISIRESRKDAAPGEAQVVPLERHDGSPVLWPSSLMGALRARAGWLAALHHLRNKNDRFAPHRGVGGEVDDREADPRKPLSSVERLFGVTGWRGRLGLEGLRFTGAVRATHRATSVSIDRFTGGGRDRLLFKTDAHLDPEFTAVLTLDGRQAVDADEELLGLLLADLERKPLFLGHGAAKGFGWFEVKVKELTGDD